MSSKNRPKSSNDEADHQKNDRHINRFTLHQYFAAMRQHKIAALVMAGGFSLAAVCYGTALPYILAQAVDLVSQRQAFYVGGPLCTTLLLAAAVAVIGVASNAIGLRGFVRVDSPAQNYIRSKVFDRLTHESAAFYAEAMTGSLTGNVIAYTNGYAAVQEVVFQRGINLALPLVVGIFIVALQSPLLAGIFVIIACGISVKTLADSRTRAPYRRARKVAGTQLNGFLGDVIGGSATVRTFAGERHEKRGLDSQQHRWRVAAQANMRMFSRHYIALAGSMNVLQVIGIGLAAWLATTGSISLGLVVFAIAYFQRLSNGLLELAPLIQTYQGALMDASPISEILMTQQSVRDVPRAKKLRVSKGDIRLANVTHGYEKDEPAVFDNLSLSIQPRESVGLVGRSGGGKTTLTHLLLRFADITTGTITIDGQDISRVTQRSLRSAIAYVPQDPQLFHRSIRENIAYGKPGASDKTIIAAAKKAHIWEFIKTLPDGLDTTVGERGVKLSGGQRQRVAIARAIVKDAPILIFDEATSALDSESERYIQVALGQLMRDRTAIIVAHRLSTIQKMDRIIVLDNGKVIESGTHAQLTQQDGTYASLWAHQSGGFMQS